MADIRTSFLYDPIRQGYDTNLWNTISGAPAIVGNGRLSVDNGTGISGSAISYIDFLKGEITFDVNVPVAPAEGITRLFGVSAPNTSAYIQFSLEDTLTCKTSDGITSTESDDIAWASSWTGANVLFKIRWEPGGAKFFINGVQVYAVADDSVPHGPLSLYLFDNSALSMTIGDMAVRGTQGYILNPATSDSTPINPVGTLSIFQSIGVSENIEMFKSAQDVVASDSIGVSENIAITVVGP